MKANLKKRIFSRANNRPYDLLLPVDSDTDSDNCLSAGDENDKLIKRTSAGSSSDDDILIDSTATRPAVSNVRYFYKAKNTYDEKVARKMLKSHKVQVMQDFGRVVLHETKDSRIVVEHPEVYEHPEESNAYIIFGVVSSESSRKEAPNVTANELGFNKPDDGTMLASKDYECNDGIEFDEEHVSMVANLASVSRCQAKVSLKSNEMNVAKAVLQLIMDT